MTMNLPMISALDLTGYPVDYRALTDMTPFTYRAGMTYEGLLESIRVWIPNTLIPYLNDNFAGLQDSWIENATGVEAQLEAALEAIATAQVPISDPVIVAAFTAQNSLTRAALDARYVQSGLTAVYAPKATGNAVTDTANIQAAIATAQAASLTLRLPSTVQGTPYKLNTGISWDVTRGSLIGEATDLDFGNLTGGYALTVRGPGTNATGSYTAHRAGVTRIDGLNMIGYSSSTVDGIFVGDDFVVDGANLENVTLNGFRDGISFGSNTWLTKFDKVGIGHFSRYGINLGCGTNAGENQLFLNCNIYGGTGTSVGVYAPAGSNVEARFIACSFDYNFLIGRIETGSITFESCHLEDNSTGAMFTYNTTTAINVSFRDCAWDSAATAVRPYIHQVLPGSGPNITVTFDGDKGGVYPNTESVWFKDDSGDITLGISSTIRGAYLSGNHLKGQFYNLLTNGDFSTNTVVAAPGVGGWTTPGAGTWTIGAGGSPGAGLQLTSSTSTTATTAQRIPLPASRQPIRVGGKMRLAAATSGSIQLGVQFLAADGTTPVLGGIRIGSTVTAVDPNAWVYTMRRFTPPPGAAFVTVQLSCGSFVGTAYWDEIEVVPV